MSNYKFIDLFAGIGGFRIALESFNEECVFSSEWDIHAQSTYKANFFETPQGDITKINEVDIPKHDIICAGFPCQAFSISGKQRGFADTRGTLFFDVARIAKYHSPKVLFLENVKNFEQHDKGRTLNVVINTLIQIGYRPFYKVLNASDYSAPTSRKRIYIVAFHNDLNIKKFSFPLPTNMKVKLADYLEVNPSEKLFIKREDIVIDHKDLQPNLNGNYQQAPIRIGKIGKGGQGERIYSVLGHAITLSAYGGGAASKTGAYLVDGIVRKLSPRECANVMGFPKQFVIPVSDTQAHKQFGNSVCITVIKEIYKEIRKCLYESEADVRISNSKKRL